MKQNSIMDIVKHINFLLDKNPAFNENVEKLFLIFDESNNAYLVTFGISGRFLSTQGLKVYEVSKKTRELNARKYIGYLKFGFNKATNNVYLELINVTKKRNSNKGIGTEMLAVLQMLGHNMGAKTYTGSFGNFSYLDKKPQSLMNFYLKNNFIFPEEYSGSSFEKSISTKELDDFKRQTITYPLSNMNITVLMPESKIKFSGYNDELEKE